MDKLDLLHKAIVKAKYEHNIEELKKIIDELDKICNSCDCTGRSIRMRSRAKQAFDQVDYDIDELLYDVYDWEDFDNPHSGYGYLL